jgi:hypothetical protein
VTGCPIEDPKTRMWVGLLFAPIFTMDGISLFHYHYRIDCRICGARAYVDPTEGVVLGSIMLFAALGMLALALDGYRKLKNKGN